MSDCALSGNLAGNNGGAQYNNGGTTAFTYGSVSDNAAVNNGGGIDTVNGTTTLTGVTVSGNSASGDGGGVANLSGTTTLINGSVSGNSGGDGGGLANVSGTTTLTNVGVSGNSATVGGGVYSANGTTTLTHSTVSGNSASGGGGGVFNVSSTTTLLYSNVNGNFAASGGGIGTYAYGTTTLSDCTVSGNTASGNGGGLNTEYNATSTLTNCTVSGNTASGNGGGLNTEQNATSALTNCTVSGNTASGNGGGLYNTIIGQTVLSSVTVSGNSAESGGGIGNGTGSVTIGNTIVGDNTSTASAPDVVGTFASLGNNLISVTDGSSGWIGSDLTGTMSLPLNPLLSPLGNYGGPTDTLAELPGSPAIDAGNNALIPAGITTDQRGLIRIVNGTVDIGAFESSEFTIAVTSGSGQSTPVSTAFPDPLVATVTANNPIEPVAGGLVTFTTPEVGASATLSGNPATITTAGTVSVSADANAIGGNYTVGAGARGITDSASFSLTNMWVPVFSAVSRTIVYGTPTITLTSHLGAGTAYPTGSIVSITLDAVTQTATVDGSGEFSTTFDTASLPVAGGPYTVTYAFAGNATFVAAIDTSTNVTVTPAPLTITANDVSRVYGAADPALGVSYSGFVNGETSSVLGGTLSVVDANAATTTRGR